MDIEVVIRISDPRDTDLPCGLGIYKLRRDTDGTLFWSTMHRIWGKSYEQCFDKDRLFQYFPILSTTAHVSIGVGWLINHLKFDDFPLEFEDGNN